MFDIIILLLRMHAACMYVLCILCIIIIIIIINYDHDFFLLSSMAMRRLYGSIGIIMHDGASNIIKDTAIKTYNIYERRNVTRIALAIMDGSKMYVP